MTAVTMNTVLRLPDGRVGRVITLPIAGRFEAVVLLDDGRGVQVDIRECEAVTT